MPEQNCTTSQNEEGLSKCPLHQEEYSTLSTRVPFPVAIALVKSQIILEPFTVRVHTGIARHPWARLWYLLRGFDFDGRGYIEFPVEIILQLLEVSSQTFYRWLEQGEAVGAFRRRKVRAGTLKVYLGGLFNVCWHLNIRKWGEVAVCLLWQVNADIRPLVTGIVTQSLQQKSRYAANQKLKPEYRKLFGAPHPNELLGEGGQSSHQSAAGQVPFLLHVSSKKVFVSRNFTSFGARSFSIGEKLGISTRTVRRHHQALGTVKRQLCQRKWEYGWLMRARERESNDYWANDGTGSTHVGYQVQGERVHFGDGIPVGAKKQRANEYDVPGSEFDGRFFIMGKQAWLAKCNIYRETYTLTTMRAARRKWRHKLSQLSLCQFSENQFVGVGDHS